MKSLKPFLLVLVGVLITVALFSFKNEEPKKEYCIVASEVVGGALHISNGDQVKDEFWPKGSDRYKFIVSTLNNLNKDGWKVIAVLNTTYNGKEYLLERTKP